MTDRKKIIKHILNYGKFTPAHWNKSTWLQMNSTGFQDDQGGDGWIETVLTGILEGDLIIYEEEGEEPKLVWEEIYTTKYRATLKDKYYQVVKYSNGWVCVLVMRENITLNDTFVGFRETLEQAKEAAQKHYEENN